MGQKISDSALAALIDPFVDARYALGNPERGWDCLNSLHRFYKAAGADFPDEWRGYDASNYAGRWQKAETQCRKDFEEFLADLGEEVVNPNFMKPGDLLLFEGKEIFLFPAIYVGSGKMIMITGRKTGMRVVPFKYFSGVLRHVRRLLK